MNRTLLTVASSTLLLVAGAAEAAQRSELVDLSCYKLRDGAPNWKAIEEDRQHGKLKKTCSEQAATPRQRAGEARSATPVSSKPTAQPSAVLRNDLSGPVSSFKFLLRKDVPDVDLFSAVTTDSDATGAEFSWTRDQVARDTIWSVNGLLALAYTYFPNSYDSPLIGVTVAPYVKANMETHSAANVNNIDVITAGGAGEIGFQNPIRGADYFRVRWSATEDHVANTRIQQVAGEWIPTYLRLLGEIPGTHLNVGIRPELEVQYDDETAGLPPLPFSGRRHSLRVGPQTTAVFNVLPWQGMPVWLQTLTSFTANVTYHWWTETYSGHESSWLTASATYNLSPNLGLTGSYQRGREEETGKRTEIYKVSVSVKMCADLFTYGLCK